MTPWGWAAVLLLPPLAVLGVSLRRRRRPRSVPTRRKSDDPSLALDRALMKLLPREDIATSERLVPALRAAGFDVRDGRRRSRRCATPCRVIATVRRDAAARPISQAARAGARLDT